MYAVIAAVLFAVAYVIHGGAVDVHTPWLNPTGLALLGLVFTAFHLLVPLPVRLRR